MFQGPLHGRAAEIHGNEVWGNGQAGKEKTTGHCGKCFKTLKNLQDTGKCFNTQEKTTKHW